MKVWVYQGDGVKVFASAEIASQWFERHDPEGVAFEYDVITEFSVENTQCVATFGSEEV